MKIAIVCEWLAFIGGAEKVILEKLTCFPQADVFAIVDGLSPPDRELFGSRTITTTFIQRLPFAKKNFEYYLPLMPIAIEQLDLRAYDLIISSSHAFAKGVMTSPDQLHISYVYSPMRYAWDMQNTYLENSHNMSKPLRGVMARIGLHYLRLWDLRTVPAVDVWLCISQHIRRRIHKYYRVEAQVIYPPVEIPKNDLVRDHTNTHEDSYYVTVSRLVEYKRIDLIVKTFVQYPHRRLWIIGNGPMEKALRQLARGCHNIFFTGHISETEKTEKVKKAQAFIFAAKEDFGIAPLEAQAIGVPVIAYGAGGALETIVGPDHKHPTGLFFHEQTIEALNQALTTFEANPARFEAQACRSHAAQFSASRFRQQFTETVMQAWEKFRHP